MLFPIPSSSDCLEITRRMSAPITLLKKRWSLPILCLMGEQPVRLSQLTRWVPGASKKGLLAALRDLEAAHIVVRRDLSGTVLHVEYELSDDMKIGVVALLNHLAALGSLIDAKRAKEAETSGATVPLTPR